MKTLGVTLTLVIAGLAAAVSVARPASTDGTLQATVGPGYTITLTQNGTKVTQLAPGTYTIDVNDRATIHNFHLSGPGVDQATDIEGTGTTTWTVTFQNGTYTYVCDAHATTMRGTFTVGSAPAPTTTSSSPTPALALRVVSAKVSKPRTVIASLKASRSAAMTATLWKGNAKLATAHATGTKATVRLVAKAALKKGSYLVKVTSGSARATKPVVVR